MSNPIHDDSLAIGVDLGATKIATTLIDRAGRVIATRHTATRPADGATATCDRIADEIRALLAKATASVAGIGIGSPGIVDAGAGVVKNAINLGWNELHLAHEIAQRVDGLPVLVANDANANAIGEGMFGNAVGSRDYVLLTVGSGLGCGAVTGGHLVVGTNGIAADLGHYAIDPDAGRACACGHRGCAETIVSGPGLVAVARKALSENTQSSRLRDDQTLTPHAIVAAARDNDAVAIVSIATLATWLGHIASVAAAVTNPDTIVIGGGLGVAAFDLIETIVQHELKRRLPTSYGGNIQLRVATLASPAVGAASLVWERATRAPAGVTGTDSAASRASSAC